MKTKKPTAVVLLILATLALTATLMGLIGCGQQGQPGVSANVGSDGKLKVVATIFPPYDFVRAIAQDRAEVSMLLPPGAESHSFEPTPQDIIRIQGCDVFIYIGGESDAWVNDILASLDTSKMRIVKLMDCVSVVEEEIVPGMQEEAEPTKEAGVASSSEAGAANATDHSTGGATDPGATDPGATSSSTAASGGATDPGATDPGATSSSTAASGGAEPEYDEHIWTSPKNAERLVQAITDALCQADSVNAGYYQQNSTSYIDKLKQLDAQFQEVVNTGVRKTIVFGDRFPFRYFVEAYGLQYFAAFPGCSSETEANAATVKFLIDKVRAEKIPVVFHIEMGNVKMAQTIADESGAKVLQLNACHTIAKADFEAGKTYIDLMNENIEPLREALQ
ncbi:MAG: metal ABC transporter substrate-binding protein [Actinomycetia bacterium]|nr:metal ABC transporter substrate-binding protein [Actinomycetes bacterium]